MMHDQLVDLAIDAIGEVFADKSVDGERRVISLTELQDLINKCLSIANGEQTAEGNDNA